MANPMTEPLEPYRPEPRYDDSLHEEYDWDYDEGRAERRPMNILWGRVAILGGIVLLAFLLGRITAGGEAAPTSGLADARERIEQLEAENAELSGQLTTAQAERDQALADLESAQANQNDSEGQSAGGEETTEPTSQTYVVKVGDSLSSLAEKFYGDASLDDFLAEVNGIDDPTALSVGQELEIPDDPPG